MYIYNIFKYFDKGVVINKFFIRDHGWCKTKTVYELPLVLINTSASCVKELSA